MRRWRGCPRSASGWEARAVPYKVSHQGGARQSWRGAPRARSALDAGQTRDFLFADAKNWRIGDVQEENRGCWAPPGPRVSTRDGWGPADRGVRRWTGEGHVLKFQRRNGSNWPRERRERRFSGGSSVTILGGDSPEAKKCAETEAPELGKMGF